MKAKAILESQCIHRGGGNLKKVKIKARLLKQGISLKGDSLQDLMIGGHFLEAPFSEYLLSSF